MEQDKLTNNFEIELARVKTLVHIVTQSLYQAAMGNKDSSLRCLC